MRTLIITPLFVLAIVVFAGCAGGKNLGTILGDLKQQAPLTQGDAAAGLKEAFTQGVTRGSNIVSQLDGYFGNPEIKIPMPTDAQKVEKTLRDLGLGSKVDEAVKSMNRAAEEAAKDAAPIFVDAIRKMTFDDALAIVRGDRTSGTQYLQRTTTPALTASFSPVIKTALDKVNATKYWADVMTTYNKIPLVTKVNTDLTAYVTEKAIAGLFTMIAKEEAEIRENPAARTTELLRRVFGR